MPNNTMDQMSLPVATFMNSVEVPAIYRKGNFVLPEMLNKKCRDFIMRYFLSVQDGGKTPMMYWQTEFGADANDAFAAKCTVQKWMTLMVSENKKEEAVAHLAQIVLENVQSHEIAVTEQQREDRAAAARLVKEARVVNRAEAREMGLDYIQHQDITNAAEAMQAAVIEAAADAQAAFAVTQATYVAALEGAVVP